MNHRNKEQHQHTIKAAEKAAFFRIFATMRTTTNNTHKKDLTLLEQAAITYIYYHNLKDWKPIYKALHPDFSGTPESLSRLTSQYKHAEKVQTYLAHLKALDQLRQPGKEKETGGKGKVFSDGKRDFTNITDFLDYCNEQANHATDERDRQQYLKFIADLLSFKNAGNDQKADIQRFYTPLQCAKCPLYQKEQGEQ